jgi:hypothetical protein
MIFEGVASFGGLFLSGHGQLVGPVVPALVRASGLRVPLDLPPSHLPVALGRFEEPLPQVPVPHRSLEVGEPAVVPPLLIPAPPPELTNTAQIVVEEPGVNIGLIMV